MNDNSPEKWQPFFDELPVDSTVDKQQSQALRDQVMQAYDERVGVSWWKKRISKTGHYLMTSKTPRFAALAATLFMAVWFFLSVGNRPAYAMQEMLDTILKARNVSFVTTMKMKGIPAIELKGSFANPGKMRQEMGFGKVTIMDFQLDKIVMIDDRMKTAVVMNLINVPDESRMAMQENNFTKMQATLREAKQDPESKIEMLGEKEIDGRALIGYRFESGDRPLTVWADPETHQPYLMETSQVGALASDITIGQFEFDKELDESLFSLEVPEGYKVTVRDVDFTLPPEETLAESLRLYCDDFEGNFPKDISLTSSFKFLSAAGFKQTREFIELKKRQDVIGKEGLKIKGELLRKAYEKRSDKFNEGFKFAMILPAESQAHYAGKGLKLGAGEQPIFWYKPAGKEEWRVLNADLEFRDSATPPEVEGAIPMKEPK